MATPVIMPKLEMSQETATVIEWSKKEGDTVEKGEPLLTVETDKVTVEVESPASGVLAGVRAEPNEVVPVTETIAFVLRPGETLPEETDTGTPITPEAPAASPVAQRMAADHGVDLREVSGSGPGGKIRREDVTAHLAKRDARREERPDRVRAVPAARRLARKLEIGLGSVQGTGPGGRVQSADVRRAAAQHPAEPGLIPQRPDVRREIPLTGMRRTIAERMLRSAREAPQFNISLEVDMARALEVVEDLRAGPESSNGPRVTLTTFLIRACSWTLARHPALNAALQEDVILEWADVNVGVATAVEEGLIVPVIHGADKLEIQEIAARLAELTARAHQGQLRPEDVQGGTFTLSNLGMFGIDTFTAILNPPQAGILAVGRVATRPVAHDDQLVIRPVATLTLTADHRVVDGAIASRFLADLQKAMEHPGIML
jgi:pyruvate dehydrogenase E2 component (dihydrolipoamide acetyltransferase)